MSPAPETGHTYTFTHSGWGGGEDVSLVGGAQAALGIFPPPTSRLRAGGGGDGRTDVFLQLVKSACLLPGPLKRRTRAQQERKWGRGSPQSLWKDCSWGPD